MSKVCGLLNGIFRITWGFVYDWLGFKIPYTIVTTIQVEYLLLFIIVEII